MSIFLVIFHIILNHTFDMLFGENIFKSLCGMVVEIGAPWLTSAYWTINQLGAILPSTNACTWNPHHIPVPAPCCMLHGLTSLPPDDVCRGNYDVTGGKTSANTLQAAHACYRCERLRLCACGCTSSMWKMWKAIEKVQGYKHKSLKIGDNPRYELLHENNNGKYWASFKEAK